MSKIETPLQARVRQAADSLRNGAAKGGLDQRIGAITTEVLGQWNAMELPRGSAFGLESLGQVVPARNGSFDAASEDPTVLMQKLAGLGMSERHQVQVTESVMMLLDGAHVASELLRDGQTINGQHADMSLVVGRSSVSGVMLGDGELGLEAFGDDINRLNTDDRLTMSLTIMRPWENIMDKALARVNDSSPVVTIRAPEPQVYDWSATQRSGSTAAERNASVPLRDLYRNPTRVNTAPKKIVAIAANDSGSVLFGGTTQFYKTGKQISTLDLSRDTNTFGFDKVDRTDLVADGAILDNILVTVTDPSNSNVKETFKLNTRAFAMAMFTTSPANRNSGQRQVILEAVLPIAATTKQYDGSNSTIAARFTDATMYVRVQVAGTLNLQTGVLHVSGSSNKEIVKDAAASAISAGTQTFYGQLLVEFSAFSVDSYFDEENQRKANLAVWCQYRELQFVIPRSRVYFTEYSLTQDVDNNAVTATASVIALGNGRRGLDTIVNRLNDVAASAAFVAANAEVASVNLMDEQSLVSSLVKPTVVSADLDFNNEQVNVMNESTRLTEIHGRFRARLLSIVAQLAAESLILNQYKGGETPVFKLFVHSAIADLVIGILDYHPDLADRTQTATGADYSMKLPNGYRIDVIKSNMDCLKERIYGLPVLESDMSSLISAASIRDCGTVTTNYAPSNAGSVVRRVATTTREIVMVSNPVGFMIKVHGLVDQIGDVTYAALPLNQDSNDALLS